MYDAIVIGSGCTGGVAARWLSEAGFSILVLEAGPELPVNVAHTPMTLGAVAHKFLRTFLTKRQSVQARHPSYWVYSSRLFVDDAHHPYSYPADREFRWIRARSAGGRSLTWGGAACRLSRYELSSLAPEVIPSWPVEPHELDPFYRELERLFLVAGDRATSCQLPTGDYGVHHPLHTQEVRFKRLVENSWPDRKVIRYPNIPDRPAANGWPVKSSMGTTLGPLLADRKVDIIYDAVALNVLRNSSREAAGVRYLETRTGRRRDVSARTVFCCASTLETLRFLLSSDIEDPSGTLGRYVMDHIAEGQLFSWKTGDTYEGQRSPSGVDHILIPRFVNTDHCDRPYYGGFGLWGAVGSMLRPDVGLLQAVGEMLPHADNHVALDRRKTDVHGVPVVHVDCAWRRNEVAILEDMRHAISDIIRCVGGEPVPFERNAVAVPWPMSIAARRVVHHFRMSPSMPGQYVHEVGGARMGTTKHDSVVDRWNQCWTVPNLFVTDGACWPSGGWQNPTLTMMAITARACARATGRIS